MIEGRTQRTMTLWQISYGGGEKIDVCLNLTCNLGTGQDSGPCGCQFDCQWNPIEQATDVDQIIFLGLLDLEIIPDLVRLMNEQGYRTVVIQLGNKLLRWHGESMQLVHPFALQIQSFAG